MIPDPFGMRWFGIFAAALLLGLLAELILPRPLGALMYLPLIVIVGLALIAASHWQRPRRWLLDRWF